MISFLLAVRQLVRVFLFVFYAGFVIVLSLLPPQDLPHVPMFEGADKVVHFLMYFIFSILFSWAIRVEIKYSRLFFVIPITITWGIFMEIMQFSMHLGRSFSWYDMLANSMGVFVGIASYIITVKSTDEING